MLQQAEGRAFESPRKHHLKFGKGIPSFQGIKYCLCLPFAPGFAPDLGGGFLAPGKNFSKPLGMSFLRRCQALKSPFGSCVRIRESDCRVGRTCKQLSSCQIPYKVMLTHAFYSLISNNTLICPKRLFDPCSRFIQLGDHQI